MGSYAAGYPDFNGAVPIHTRAREGVARTMRPGAKTNQATALVMRSMLPVATDGIRTREERKSQGSRAPPTLTYPLLRTILT
jgi:hypothetical protein